MRTEGVEEMKENAWNASLGTKQRQKAEIHTVAVTVIGFANRKMQIRFG